VDKNELARFLRSRREQITPEEVGLPRGSRRRTPGLRREEVAQLAYISSEYYTRLEQGRAPNPTGEVLTGIARALGLSDVEREHLHHLAGTPLRPSAGPSRVVRASIRELLERLPLTAGFVTSAGYDVLAWNDLAAALMEDYAAVPPAERNLARRAFLGPSPDGRWLYGVSDADQFRLDVVHRLRAAVGRYPADPGLRALVTDLLRGSTEFARLWASHDVGGATLLRKTFDHPVVGPVTLRCDVLDIARADQQLVLYTPDPASASEEALRLLAALGPERVGASS
jgi:transcriptional regulator with XRE-family HTH domain